MDDFYRLDVAESNHGNQTAPSPTIFERQAIIVNNYVCSKMYIGMTDLTGQIFVYVLVELLRQGRDGALVSLRCACAGSIIATQRMSVTPYLNFILVTIWREREVGLCSSSLILRARIVYLRIFLT